MLSWIITIPKTVSWESYQKEIASVADGSQVMNYHTRYFPKEMRVHDRCYIVYDGQVRGYMNIVGLEEHAHTWQCSTTGEVWPAGKYIQRSGPFFEVTGMPMSGFRGIRKFPA